VVFIVEDGDHPSVEEAARLARPGRTGWCVNKRTRNYAGAVNTAYQLMCAHPEDTSEYVFTGADDLRFHPGWAEHCLAAAEQHPGARVIGTNDLFNPYVLQQTHATHYLVDRRYLDSEHGGVPGVPPAEHLVLFEGYDHNFTDTEFIDAAKGRGVFVPCMDAVVEHMHVMAGKAQWDATYYKGHAHMQDDYSAFKSREPLWTDSPDNRRLM
jgi:hypothetical protein